MATLVTMLLFVLLCGGVVGYCAKLAWRSHRDDDALHDDDVLDRELTTIRNRARRAIEAQHERHRVRMLGTTGEHGG